MTAPTMIITIMMMLMASPDKTSSLRYSRTVKDISPTAPTAIATDTPPSLITSTADKSLDTNNTNTNTDNDDRPNKVDCIH